MNKKSLVAIAIAGLMSGACSHSPESGKTSSSKNGCSGKNGCGKNGCGKDCCKSAEAKKKCKDKKNGCGANGCSGK